MNASPATEPRTTPLCQAHRRLGAKMIDFGGWLMPVNYPAGILEEHKATRTAVGMFDVCHMGEVHFRGARAAEAVQRLVTNQVSRLYDGRAMYTVACNPKGGIVDDLIVYRVKPDHFLIVVNAANIAKDYGHFMQQVGSWCEIRNASDETGLISFQGPKAQVCMAPLTRAPLATLRLDEPIVAVAPPVDDVGVVGLGISEQEEIVPHKLELQRGLFHRHRLERELLALDHPTVVGDDESLLRGRLGGCVLLLGRRQRLLGRSVA